MRRSKPVRESVTVEKQPDLSSLDFDEEIKLIESGQIDFDPPENMEEESELIEVHLKDVTAPRIELFPDPKEEPWVQETEITRIVDVERFDSEFNVPRRGPRKKMGEKGQKFTPPINYTPEMTEHEKELCRPILDVMPEEFRHEVQRNNDGTLCLKLCENGAFHATVRANLHIEEDVNTWMKSFSDKTRTCWIIGRCYPDYNGRIYLFRKDFKCQHASANKSQINKHMRSRDFNCKATVSLRIKSMSNWCMRRADYFQYLKRDLTGIIKLNLEHSHPTDSAQVLGYLRAKPETKEMFLQYFRNGLTVSESIRTHKEKLRLEAPGDMFIGQILADASLNPRPTTVYNWHKEYREASFGKKSKMTGSEMFQKLKERLPDWKKRDFDVKLTFEKIKQSDETREALAVAILTPVMKRSLETLPFTKHVILVDSTPLPDDQEMNLTVLSSESPCGSAPIGILFTRGLHTAAYKRGFEHLTGLFQKNMGDRPFDGQGYPKNILTVEDGALRQALVQAFPNSEVKLFPACASQVVWHWLIDSEQKIDRSDCPAMIGQFMNMQRAENEREFDEAYKQAHKSNQATRYSDWMSFLDDFCTRKSEWAMSCRNEECLVEGYCEATVGLYRNVVFSRRVYNSVALVEYLTEELERMYMERYSTFVKGEEMSVALDLVTARKKIDSNWKIAPVQDDIFAVWTNEYACLLTTSLANCSNCIYWEAIRSIYCPHLAAVVHKHPEKAPLPAATDYSVEAMRMMGKIVYATDDITVVCDEAADNDGESIDVEESNFAAGPSTSTAPSEEVQLRDEVSKFWRDFEEKIWEFGSPGSVAGVKKLAKRVKGIRSQAQFESFLSAVGMGTKRQEKSSAKSPRVAASTASASPTRCQPKRLRRGVTARDPWRQGIAASKLEVEGTEEVIIEQVW